MATKSKKNTKKNAAKKNTKNYLPTYIISMLTITLLVAVFMYIEYGEGGILNIAVKKSLCGMFGICGFFVPVLLAGVTAYLIKVKDTKKFWIKLGLSFLALINMSSLVNLSLDNDMITYAFIDGYTNYEGGGFLGACVSVFLNNMIEKLASYIILGLTLVILASLISNVSIFSEAAKAIKKLFESAQDKYADYTDERERRISERNNDIYEKTDKTSNPILDAANSFANDTDYQTKKVKKDKKKDTDEPFSDGIDDVFADVAAEDVSSKKAEEKTPVRESTQQKEEKADKISEKEKEQFNDEFNKAIETPVVKYTKPPMRLLNNVPASSGDKREEMRHTAEKLISVLKDFGVNAKLVQVTQGPTVTRYEISPETGVKLSKIVGLADDIALNLAVSTVLVAPVPGKAAVGVEIPNNKVSSVTIREMLDSDVFKKSKSKLTFALGKDIGGKVVVGDIAKMPHLLIAGATGSGKSVCINTMIMSLLYKAKPDEVKIIMVDPKRVELGVYNGIPHLLVPVVTDPKKAAGALNWAVTEMMHRYDLFTEAGVRQLDSYNKLMEKDGGEKIPQLVIIIDELADLMMVAAKEVEDYIVRLTQLARAAGIYLVIATQRPSVDVITGLIKANVPSRIALAVSSQVDSRTIIDKGGAEKLLGKGDMLYNPAGARSATRVQGAFVTDAEIEAVVEFIKENSGETHYSEDLEEEIERHATGENGVTPDTEEDGDALLPEAIELAVSLGKISTSMVQRRLGVGYSRAGRIIDQMEARGIISGANGSKPRDVLVSHADIAVQAPSEEDNYEEE
ncbi:MAG: DNA translocase FtsK 4TM domain-containing protein [Oscillospiraceae bacterium]|nr:DNA translocase FtsK 4TM domain-containing protein [Oscillospiraceae bacterium]